MTREVERLQWIRLMPSDVRHTRKLFPFDVSPNFHYRGSCDERSTTVNAHRSIVPVLVHSRRVQQTPQRPPLPSRHKYLCEFSSGAEGEDPWTTASFVQAVQWLQSCHASPSLLSPVPIRSNSICHRVRGSLHPRKFGHVCGDLWGWPLEAEGQEAVLSVHARATQKVRDTAIDTAGCIGFATRRARQEELEKAFLIVGVLSE